MYHLPSQYDANAFPPSLKFASIFAGALVAGVLLFETAAALLA